MSFCIDHAHREVPRTEAIATLAGLEGLKLAVANVLREVPAGAARAASAPVHQEA